jgi:CspA family cold shock protein
MVAGTVKSFNNEKSCGLVKPDNGGEELFAHFSAINIQNSKALSENQLVTVDITAGPKSQQALKVRLQK